MSQRSPTGAIYQNTLNCLRSQGIELLPVFPLRTRVREKSQPGLVNQRCQLQRVTRSFIRRFICGQTVQLRIRKWKHFSRDRGIDLVPAAEDLCEVAHERRLNEACRSAQYFTRRQAVNARRKRATIGRSRTRQPVCRRSTTHGQRWPRAHRHSGVKLHTRPRRERRATPRTMSEPKAFWQARHHPYFGRSSETRDFSSFSSFSVAVILARLNSLTGAPWTISHFFPSLRIG